MLEHEGWAPALLHVMARDRQGEMCASCWERMGPGDQELHHRQSRRVLGWCPCNIVGLHRRCHTQGPAAVHDHPEAAILAGLIVPTWEDPRVVAVTGWRWLWEAPSLLTCDGMVAPAP